MSKDKQVTPEVARKKTLEEIKSLLSNIYTKDYPNLVLREADKEVESKEKGKMAPASPESNIFKSMTLFEFDIGALLTTLVPEQYKTFGINLMHELQKEFDCQSTSEKALSELAAVNFIRTLEIQRRINNYLDIGTITDTGMKFLAVMSLELDRANRHYLTTIEALKALKQPHLGINIKAQTAVIGQNQVVQSNNSPNDS